MTLEKNSGPRVGVPFRTSKEEAQGQRRKFEFYLRAIREAGGQPVEVSLRLAPEELRALAQTLDAIVLPGSPADVDPARYNAPRQAECEDPDAPRERTDFALLDHAFAQRKPVLAICYGVQSLNVYLGGTLVQDIPSELSSMLQHEWIGRQSGAPEPFHAVRIEPGTRLALLAGATGARVNSSHHQSIARPGRNLRVTAHAPDAVVEAVELRGDSHWVTGVQWHPERMVGDSLAAALFRALVSATRAVTV